MNHEPYEKHERESLHSQLQLRFEGVDPNQRRDDPPIDTMKAMRQNQPKGLRLTQWFVDAFNVAESRLREKRTALLKSLRQRRA